LFFAKFGSAISLARQVSITLGHVLHVLGLSA
jgi:hypothetical protein